ncbi:hypothetical protein D9M71_594430 [compost metagenome]
MLQIAGQGLVRRFVCRARQGLPAQIHDLGLWRITQAGIGTALEADLDLAGRACRDLQLKALAINLLFAEEFITVEFPLRQRGMLVDRQTVELQALLIQVIAIGNLPEQLGFAGLKAF